MVNFLRFKQLLVTAALLLGSVPSFAYDFEVDGIYYEKLLYNATVAVTSNPNKYSGEVVIPATVTYDGVNYPVSGICTNAFSDCGGLTSISIPDEVVFIDNSAFSGCSGLTTINIPQGVSSIRYKAFYACSSLTSINIPDGVTSIGDCAFSQCSGLTSINIPDGVTSIGLQAFWMCSGLTTINIGKEVSSIGFQAFYGCDNVQKIVCKSDTPPACSEEALLGIPMSECTLYVPEGSLSSYQATAPWSEFTNIVGVETGINSVKINESVVVSVNAGIITISGTTNGETIEIYNVGGSKIKEVKANDGNTTIGGLQSGNVYIVKIGGTKVKVAM